MEDKYTDELFEKILNHQSWPNFPEIVSELQTIAITSFKKDTTEGYVASILIFHQIIEEALKTLIKLSELLVKAHIWPSEIEYQFNEERKMFGQVLGEFERSIDFKEKKELINVAREMNGIRIGIVHKLTSRGVGDVKNEADKFRMLYSKFMELYGKGEDSYIWMLDDLRRSVYMGFQNDLTVD
ncbi:hypothetical protein J7E81_01440 [Bacillus sp. ISL-18]|uniref:hypothetical protein n=1 Tax=Bacillus sp. ISL-18 TaxID=2819118 RepID=UPI001BE56189|nr:hypothetical protein [Bacillus sp. ISL-18]MBT2653909.1 hypothetical protein [Bacillus sp. ISL-18]